MRLARTPDDCSEQLSLAPMQLVRCVGLPDKEQRIHAPNVPNNVSLTAHRHLTILSYALNFRKAYCLLRRSTCVGAADSDS